MSLDTEFRELCLTAGTPPNVFQFLQDRQPSEPEQWLAILHAHQQHLWRVDQPLVVEDYLAALSQMPGLPNEVDWRLQLAIGELEARRETANPLSDAEISSRFPDLSDTLRQRLQSASSVEEAASESTIKSPDPAPSDQVIDSRATHSIGIDSIIGNSHSGAEHKGRYRLDRVLGEGTFGRVYLAYDQDLHRQVAVKVPAKGRFESPDDAESYLAEARTVASLDHPHIVSVYDMGRAEDGSVYVVSRYIEGTTLEAIIREGRATPRDSAVMIATVANALQYAHDKRLIHRDIKPANILIDGKSGTPFVADFGLAIREDDYLKLKTIAGTPAYMSPEQARGEGHRLDGRSDIFALGVVLYEMLSGKKPFEGRSIAETLESVISHLPTPLRQLDETIDAELERICLKALSKRASDRYSTAAAMADDLEAWLQPKPETNQPQPGQKPERLIVPRGLRSFGPDDADFFLDLLPGPRSRQGLPESIAFWKQRIEQTDPEQTFSVGLIYGPSGCGKSSLVKAGLLPHLSDMVIAVYVEATSVETETRVLRGLQKRLPELSQDLGLADALAALRRGEGNKVIIIIDQFEQWLHAHRAAADAELVKALRQCDGGRVQAILMIRDDFYVAALRLMQALDIEVVPGKNFLLVDLFDVDHAEKVLIRFGQAFGKLPANATNLSAEQAQFVSRVASGLAQDGKVVSVRLSLFAEMVKGKPWQPTTLDQVGGTQGIGFNFLEETFASAHADPRFRRHAVASRGVLSALLPERDTDIKGSMRSHADLLAASGYQDRTADFNELLRILDSELRLITPTDPEGEIVKDSTASDSDTARYYQLTHDYLVPSLRQWLTRKQQETPKGRAELKLAERASLWHAKPENRYLPSPWEWFTIRRLTDSGNWKPQEQAVMRRAGRVHATRGTLLTTAIAILVVLGFVVRGQVLAQQERARVEGLVAQLTTAEPARVPEIVKQLDAAPELAQELVAPLLDFEAKTIEQQRSRLHAQLAIVGRDAAMVDLLLEELLSNKVAYIGPIRELLQPHAAAITERLQAMLRDPQLETKRRFRAGVALAGFIDPASPWEDQDLQFLATQLVSENAEYQPVLRDNLRPVSAQLLGPLKALFKDAQLADAMRLGAANAVADFAANQPELLTRLLADATPEQYEVLYSLVEKSKSDAGIAELKQIAATLPADDMGSVARIGYGQRRANAAVSLLRLGERESVLPVFDWTDDPEALTQFIFRCKPRGISVDTLLDLFDLVAAAPGSYPKDARYALLLAIGEYDPSEIPPARREALVNQLGDWYASDPSSGVHGASGWLLRHLGENEIVTRVDQTPVPYSPDREWFTLAITVTPTSPPKQEEKPTDENTASEAETQTDESSDAEPSEDERTEQTDESNSTEPAKDEAKSEPPPEPLPPRTFYYTFIVFPAKESLIGSVEDELERSVQENRELRHKVNLTRPFALLDREVTFEELIAFSPDYKGYMQQLKAEPADAGFGPHWYDSVSFCRWLSLQSGLSESDQSYADPKSLAKEEYPREPDPEAIWAPRNWPLELDRRGFRLPTESEWEVASRAGSRTAYGYGSDVGLLGEFGWFLENSGKQVHAPRELRPTVRGAFDLHGNLFEWTHDWYDDFGESALTDPLGAKGGSRRVLRGGSWDYDAASCRSAFRITLDPTLRSFDYGFRVALSPSSQAQESAEQVQVEEPVSGAKADR